jgi:putative ABC transport system permease protein
MDGKGSNRTLVRLRALLRSNEFYLIPMSLVIGTLAGAVAGVGIVLLLGPALGLELLAGGLGAPPLRGDPWFVAAVAAGVLVVFGLATTAELSAHRRDRLSDVMRTR